MNMEAYDGAQIVPMAVPMISWNYWKWLLVTIMYRNDRMVPGRGELSGRSAILFLMCWITVSMPFLCWILLYISHLQWLGQAPSGRLGRLSVREEVFCAFREWWECFHVWLYYPETMGRKGQSWVVFGVIKRRKSCRQFFLCCGGCRWEIYFI